MKKAAVLSLPFYPLIFGLYIPLNYFTHNQALYAFSNTMRSLLIAPLLVGLLQAILWLVIRRPHFVALATTLLVGYAVYFRIKPSVEAPIVIAALFILWLAYREKISPGFSRMMNVLMLVVLVQPVIAIGTFKQAIKADHIDPLGTSPFSQIEIQKPRDSSTLPTIVHIVLDAYASNATLLELFDYDNSAFTDELTEQGFIVSNNVRTPYNQTLLVMSAVFSGTYFKSGEGPLSETNSDQLRGALGTIVTEGALQQRLIELDYNYLFVESGYEFLRSPDYATTSRPGQLPKSKNPYEADLIRFLNFLPREREPDPLGALFENAYLRDALTTNIYRTAETPFLLYEHILAPHPPFTIDRNGKDTLEWNEFNSIQVSNLATQGDQTRFEEYKQGYLEKLRYVNRALMEQTRDMIREIPGPKIIMVHGDHGSGTHQNVTDPNSPGDTCLSERYNTFLAVYSDNPIIRDKFSSLKSERFNLINLYRLIFDINFGTELGLLEDQSFYAAWDTPQKLNLLNEQQIVAECHI